MFDSGNDSWIGWALEPSPYTPPTPTTGLTPTWADEPNFTYVGHSKLPQGKRGLGTSKGRAIGMAAPAYNKLGLRAPSITVQFAPGSLALILKCLRATEDDVLPEVVLYEGVMGSWTRVYRGCKCSNLSLDFGTNNGQGGELMVSATFEAISRYDLSTNPTVSRSDLRALGKPLMWHDVRTLNVTGADSTVYGIRRGVSALSLTCNHTLQRIGQRPNYGENNHFSRCTEELRETDIVVNGDVTFNQKLPPALFEAAKNSLDWGNLSVYVSDGPALASGGQGFTMVASNCTPADESDGGGESSAIRTHQIPILAHNLTCTLGV